MNLLSNISTKIVNAASADAVVNQIVPKIVDNIVLPIVNLLFAIATVYLIYGIFRYFIYSTDPTKRTEGQQHILYGVIGIAIMVSVYGIIRFVASSVGQPSPF